MLSLHTRSHWKLKWCKITQNCRIYSHMWWCVKSFYSCSCPDGMIGNLCDEIGDKCLSNPCQHGGTCVSLAYGYQCQCDYPYEGLHCERDTDVCVPNPCLHDGTCFYDNRVSRQYTCVCGNGFIGMFGCQSWMVRWNDPIG